MDPERERGRDGSEGRATAQDPAWELGELLGRELGREVSVRFGRSRGHPVIARSPSGRERQAEPRLAQDGLVVRLHGVFATAPSGVWADLASWLRVGGRARAASVRLDRWIDAALAQLPAAPERELGLRTLGRVHDLGSLTGELLAAELAAEFSERPPPRVTWGRRRVTGARRVLRLGSYEPARHLVRIHPVLDQPAVPPLYVRAVLFHELLHAASPPRQDAAGRWIQHPPEFRRRERARPEHAAALAFERRHLDALLRSTRTGCDLVLETAGRRRARPRPGGPGA